MTERSSARGAASRHWLMLAWPLLIALMAGLVAIALHASDGAAARDQGPWPESCTFPGSRDGNARLMDLHAAEAIPEIDSHAASMALNKHEEVQFVTLMNPNLVSYDLSTESRAILALFHEARVMAFSACPDKGVWSRKVMGAPPAVQKLCVAVSEDTRYAIVGSYAAEGDDIGFYVISPDSSEGYTLSGVSTRQTFGTALDFCEHVHVLHHKTYSNLVLARVDDRIWISFDGGLTWRRGLEALGAVREVYFADRFINEDWSQLDVFALTADGRFVRAIQLTNNHTGNSGSVVILKDVARARVLMNYVYLEVEAAGARTAYWVYNVIDGRSYPLASAAGHAWIFDDRLEALAYDRGQLVFARTTAAATGNDTTTRIFITGPRGNTFVLVRNLGQNAVYRRLSASNKMFLFSKRDGGNSTANGTPTYLTMDFFVTERPIPLLHGLFDRGGLLYDSPSVLGPVFAHLAVPNAHTVWSRDGGLTWDPFAPPVIDATLLPNAHIGFATDGTYVLLMPTIGHKIFFSLNYGKDWNPAMIRDDAHGEPDPDPDEPDPKSFTIVPFGTATCQFVVFQCHTHGDVAAPRKVLRTLHLVHFDLSSLKDLVICDPDLHDGTGFHHVEIWTNDLTPDTACSCGTKYFHYRRKSDVACRTLPDARVAYDLPCLCRESDYVCDEGFNKVNNKCQAVENLPGYSTPPTPCIIDYFQPNALIAKPYNRCIPVRGTAQGQTLLCPPPENRVPYTDTPPGDRMPPDAGAWRTALYWIISILNALFVCSSVLGITFYAAERRPQIRQRLAAFLPAICLPLPASNDTENWGVYHQLDALDQTQEEVEVGEALDSMDG